MIEVYAFYFPQLYKIQENSEWWGEGFTDWLLVKKSKPIFKGHNQPRVPLMGYQDQSKMGVMEDQVELANKYGVTGFNFYHYWFDSKPYLDIPINNLLKNKSLDARFMLTWANESWTRQWVGKPNEYLLEQKYYTTQSEIDVHYQYLVKYFKDSRYRKVDNSPVMAIYRPELIPDLALVLSRFNDLAVADGFSGMYFMACRSYDIPNAQDLYSKFNGVINFNPRYTINTMLKKNSVFGLEKYLRALPEKLQSKLSGLVNFKKSHVAYSYKELIASLDVMDSFVGHTPVYQSVIPDWDNTARYGERATLFTDVSADSFREMIDISISQLSDEHLKIVFVNAWNEWSEGAYLEPDSKVLYTNLEVLRDAISEYEIIST